MNIYQFVDQFGIAVFIYLILDGLVDIEKDSHNNRAWVRIIIGLLGLFVDLYSVTMPTL